MTNYTNTMREALKSMYISEDNIAMLRDIVKRKSAKSIKFADGTMKVDLFTASAVIQALDKVNPATKAKITKLINTGKKANFMGVAKVVMKSENDPEIKEEVSLETEEVSLLAQQAAILISKRERERNPRKEQVQLDEEMNPTDHVKKKGDKYCVYNADGSIAKEFDNEEDANRYAIDNHDSLMGEEADLDEAVNKDWQKAVHDLSKKMGASVASGAKGKIIPFVSMNGDTTNVGYTDSKGKKHTIYTTKKSLPRAEKDKMIADIRKKFSEEFSEEVELDEEKMPSHAELVKGKYGDAHAGAQHFSKIGGKEYTWNYLERKGGKYVVTTKKTGEIGLSRAGSKDFKTAKIVKEESELDEGQLKDMLAQAGDIEYYAKRHGGIDKKDMMKAASLLKKGNKSGALNFVSKLDTSPREKILDLMGEEVELDEKMKPVDPKTAKMIAKIIARNKLDYNFEYGLSKNNIADIKKQGGKPPRGVGPMGGGSLYDLLVGLGDTDSQIYLDGADLVDGAKTIAKWKGMTVGDMLKKARLRYEEVEVQEKRAIRNYKYDKAFFINDGKDKLKNLLDREGYDEISLGDYLSQKAGLKNRDNLYFDGGSLVYGSKTIVKGAHGKTVSQLLDVVKNIKEEVEESYELGTDEYTKHTKDVTPGQGKEIDEARPSARRDAMRDMDIKGTTPVAPNRRGKKDPADDAADDVYKATTDDRKAADKNIIMQLRKATNLGGKYEVTFKDKKRVKVKPEIAMAFLKKFEKMKPADKAKLQDKGSKSYKDLLKGLKEEDTSMLGRIERKLKEIRNG